MATIDANIISSQVMPKEINFEDLQKKLFDMRQGKYDIIDVYFPIFECLVNEIQNLKIQIEELDGGKKYVG
jgi:hypothetical protein